MHLSVSYWQQPMKAWKDAVEMMQYLGAQTYIRSSNVHKTPTAVHIDYYHPHMMSSTKTSTYSEDALPIFTPMPW